MINTTLYNSLQPILIKNIESQESWMTDRFLKIFYHFYPIPIFKNFFDLILTNAIRGKVKFKLQDARFFEIDEGNCLTMLNKEGLSYVITIKQLAGEVIIHELSHLLEKELQGLLDLPSFAAQVNYDLSSLPPLYLFMKAGLHNLFVESLKGYHQKQHLSEIFARFFQFFAGAKDLAFDRPGDYNLQQAMTVFRGSLELLAHQLQDKWKVLLDPDIANISSAFQAKASPQKKPLFSNQVSRRAKIRSNKDPR